MGYRETIKFALSVGVLLASGVSGAGAGYVFGHKAGYDLAWDKANAHYRDFVPKGEPIDWAKVKPTLPANP